MIQLSKILLLFTLASALFAGLPFRCTGCERDEHGKIKRSRKAVEEFRKANPAPIACKSQRCVVDHIIPLACAANADDHKKLDQPLNMQWQTAAAGKAKDAWEKQLCGVTANERMAIAGRHGQKLPPYLIGVGAKSLIQ